MPMFELSPDTRLLTDVRLKMGAGETMTYEAMTTLLSRKVGGSDATLHSARRRAEREDGFVFGSVRKVGIKRLADVEIVDLGETGAKALRRSASRTARKVANVQNFDALSDDLKARHNGALALFGGVMAAAKGSTLRRLERAANIGGRLSLGRTFELFSAE